MVGGMYTEAIVNFAEHRISPMATTGTITLHPDPDAQNNAVKWAILLPQNAVEVASVTIGNDNNFTAYVPAVTVGQYYVGNDNNGVMIESATPADEHEYVDLGLPSGLLWATCNEGADSPEEYGGYFAWAETETKTNYSWDTYTYYGENNTTKYNRADGLTTLDSGDDVATVLWGDDWRMPTQAEWEELLNNTTHTKTTQDGVDGLLFTARNGNSSLFLPAAGYRWGSGGDYDEVGRQCRYWTSSLTDMEYPQYVSGFFCKRPEDSYVSDFDRNVGEPVRAVRAN